jgi:hypothetical protein
LALEVLFDCAIAGYSRLSFSSDVDALCRQVRTFCIVSTNCHFPDDHFIVVNTSQWGRLRGGTYSVLRASVRYSITDYSADIISNLINAECEAATNQCNQGNEWKSVCILPFLSR